MIGGASQLGFAVPGRVVLIHAARKPDIGSVAHAQRLAAAVAVTVVVVFADHTTAVLAVAGLPTFLGVRCEDKALMLWAGGQRSPLVGGLSLLVILKDIELWALPASRRFGNAMLAPHEHAENPLWMLWMGVQKTRSSTSTKPRSPSPGTVSPTSVRGALGAPASTRRRSSHSPVGHSNESTNHA